MPATGRYAYSALDYGVTAVNVSAPVTLGNGVAVGLIGSSGMTVSSSLTGSGQALQLNEVASVLNVQERYGGAALVGNYFISGSGANTRLDFR